MIDRRLLIDSAIAVVIVVAGVVEFPL